MTVPDNEHTVELDDSVRATLQHIGMLHERQQKLLAMREEAEAQMLHRLGVAHRAGEVDDMVLVEVFRQLKALDIPGRSTRWDAHISIRWAAMVDVGRWKPNGPAGTWIGDYPLDPAAAGPRPGRAVVYVLYDADNEPCYVGSTAQLRQRMKQHAKDGKVFTRWHAYPCRNREHAYELEDRLLKEHMPHLNRRAGR